MIDHLKGLPASLTLGEYDIKNRLYSWLIWRSVSSSVQNLSGSLKPIICFIFSPLGFKNNIFGMPTPPYFRALACRLSARDGNLSTSIRTRTKFSSLFLTSLLAKVESSSILQYGHHDAENSTSKGLSTLSATTTAESRLEYQTCSTFFFCHTEGAEPHKAKRKQLQ